MIGSSNEFRLSEADLEKLKREMREQAVEHCMDKGARDAFQAAADMVNQAMVEAFRRRADKRRPKSRSLDAATCKDG